MKNFILYSIIALLSIYNLFIYNRCNYLESDIYLCRKDNDFLCNQNSTLKIELSSLR